MARIIWRAECLVVSLAVALIVASWLGIKNTAGASPKEFPVAAAGDVIRIVTPDNRARLCPKPNCAQGQERLRISTNMELKVESSSRYRMPLWDVVWYKVTYRGKQGWVSEFDTNKAPKEPRYR